MTMQTSFVIESQGHNDGLWREEGMTNALCSALKFCNERANECPKVAHRIIQVLHYQEPVGLKKLTPYERKALGLD